ncbi:hypothetical protein [Wenxinia saemankumensis]|uniref:Uncharacterized protein n=1 Tax=Wenxinia saemankumensis TaxID=1447782 RepID=A0A1M6F0L7_9RHOB|nr:hypothetical protein [Wenxinia saemankumensis]SHI91205.1 hypothetical protein SAMN05444417_2284 [Wenxinia saemankumensis]
MNPDDFVEAPPPVEGEDPYSTFNDFFAVYRKDTGEIVSAGSGGLIGIDTETHGIWRFEHEGPPRDIFGWYVPESGPAERPAPYGFPAAARAPFSVDLTYWPEGTAIAVMNEALEESTFTTDAADPVLTLADPGRWRLIVEPPFPYRDETVYVEVTHA